MYILNEAPVTEWYHGSDKKITNWSTDFTGQGTDQNGAGIYFTSNLEDATGYKKNSQGVVHVVELKTTKWLSPTKKPIASELEKMIKWADGYETMLENWDEDTTKALKICLKAYVSDNDTHFEAIQSIEADFYRGDGANYCSSLVALGYDGVQVKRGFMNTIHAIIWNPKIIKVKDVI